MEANSVIVFLNTLITDERERKLLSLVSQNTNVSDIVDQIIEDYGDDSDD